ncbi:MAG: pyridoxal-phosphate dependent enzyme [Proteobacteria bacterium]|nr:pyridoxal-phosphate dependent enzyme [Pseudomonadota bacterium]
MALHINTPLLLSRPLSTPPQRTVWLKLDALQPSGSFKIRGIGFACEEHKRRGARRFISSSGGNAGLAVAYAGARLGIPVTVVVPESTPERARSLIRLEGAELVVHGASWQEANAHAQTLVSEADAFIHPFDDPLLWQGHATLIDEIVSAGVTPDAVVTAVGGGGLYCGLVQGLRKNGLDAVPVIAVETDGAASFAGALKAGERIELKEIATVATSLGAKKVAEQAFNLGRSHPTVSLTVSDQSAVRACSRLLDDHRVLVEPACGAALSVLYENRPELERFRQIVCIVCGGAGITATYLQELQRKTAT